MQDVPAATEILCFGSVRASVAGKETPIKDKAADVVATLATDRRGVATDQILDEVWGTDSSGSLSQLIYRVRQKLGKDVIENDGGRYRLRGPVDLWEFTAAIDSEDVDALATALSRWSGTPFDGCDTPRLVLERERLRRVRSDLATILGTKIARLRRDELVHRVTDAAMAELENESLVAAAMAALAAHGRQRQALELAQQCRRRLRDELGLEPTPILLDAERQVLTGRPAAVRATTPANGEARLASSSSNDHQLVGRAGILARLTSEVAQSASGPGRLVQIEGAPGSGKTTVAETFLGRLSETVRVRTGRSAVGQLVAYEPWIQALPELNAHLPLLTSTEDPTINRLLFSRAVVSQLQALADPELVVLFDDVHACDSASAALVRFVADAPLPAGVTVVCLSRPSIGHEGPWSSVTLDLLRNPTVGYIELGDLSLADVRLLVERQHGSDLEPDHVDRLAEFIHRRSSGNALVTSMLTQDVRSVAAIPENTTVPAALAAHLESISDDEIVSVLAPAAVAGLEFSLSTVSQLVDRPISQLLETLRRASDLRIVCELDEPDMFCFEHDLTREHFESKLLTSQLRRYAARLVRAETTSDANRLRYVRLAGDLIDNELAVTVLLDASKQLIESVALEEADRTLGYALDRLSDDDPRRVGALIERASCCSRLSRGDEGRRLRDEAFAIGHANDDYRAMCGAALAGLPDAESHVGEVDRVAKMDSVDLDRLGELRPLAERLWAFQSRLVGDYGKARDILAASRYVDDVGGADVHVELEQLMLDSTAAHPRAVSHELAAIGDALDAGPLLADVRHRQAVAELAEQLPTANETVEVARREAARHGTPRTRWAIELVRHAIAACGMDTSEPYSVEAVRQIGRRAGQRDADSAAEGQAFGQLWLDDSVAVVHGLIEADSGSVMIDAARAFSAARSGAAFEAVADARDVQRRLLASPEGIWNAVAAAQLIEAAQHIELPAEIVQTSTAILEPLSGFALIRGVGFAYLGPVDRYLAIAALVQGDAESSEIYLRQALAQASSTGATVWRDRIVAALDGNGSHATISTFSTEREN